VLKQRECARIVFATAAGAWERDRPEAGKQVRRPEVEGERPQPSEIGARRGGTAEDAL